MKCVDKRGYIRFTNDPTRTAWEHIRVAEQTIGRKLGKYEKVHHINGNKTDNNPTNLMVLRTEKDHRLVHSKIPCELFKTKDGSYIAVPIQRECKNCKRLFIPENYRVVYCSDLCYKQAREINIPDPKVLAKEIWEIPAIKLAQKYKVSDCMIGKWCAKFGIKKPGRGYWSKKLYSKQKDKCDINTSGV